MKTRNGSFFLILESLNDFASKNEVQIEEQFRFVNGQLLSRSKVPVARFDRYAALHGYGQRDGDETRREPPLSLGCVVVLTFES
jgi:hypothetical protein